MATKSGLQPLTHFVVPAIGCKTQARRLQNGANTEPKSMKNGSEPINIDSFSCTIRIRNQNWTESYPKPDFDQFSKKLIYLAERNMGMKPSNIQDLWRPAWGSKAALKKLSLTWFPTDFDRFKVRCRADFYFRAPSLLSAVAGPLVYIYIYI